MPENETIETLRAQLLDANEKLSAATTENENFKKTIAAQEKELNTVRTLNQQYFLKLNAQYTPNHDPAPQPDPEPEKKPVEDFLKNFSI